MEYRSDSNGWATFLEHWWFLVAALTALVALQVINFLSHLTGTGFIWCYGIALTVSAVGIALIFYAKIPLYQERRFSTFGSAAIPEARRPFYRCGYRCVIAGAILLACLLVSHP